ncbi:hypothetical protein N8D56_05285 [Devosia sp. A8/3-2]|nr:hypothetical protein N8D56_05285 [Devosia sp. A8/3-2]
MATADRSAGALDRRDEAPNVELAEELVAREDKAGIAEVVALVRSGTSRQRNDGMKVLYEIGARRPDSVGGYCPVFLEALASSNNKQVWGAMAALDSVAEQRADTLVAELPRIMAAADKGSVIAKDRCTSISVKLARAGYAQRPCRSRSSGSRMRRPTSFPHMPRKRQAF